MINSRLFSNRIFSLCIHFSKSADFVITLFVIDNVSKILITKSRRTNRNVFFYPSALCKCSVDDMSGKSLWVTFCDVNEMAFRPLIEPVGFSWTNYKTECTSDIQKTFILYAGALVVCSYNSSHHLHLKTRMCVITVYNIYNRTVSFTNRILPALQNRLKPVYGLFVQSNMHHTLDICQDQPGRNQMYQI